MDENQKQNNNDDLTVGSDGNMKTEDGGQKIVVNTPVVNDVTPPPAPKVTTDEPTSQPIEVTTDSVDGSAEHVVPPSTNSAAEQTEVLASPPEETVEQEKKPTDDETSPLSESTETSVESTPSNDQSMTAKDVVSAQMADSSEGRSHESSTAQMAEVGVAVSQMNKAPHRNNKKLAAIVTVIVALVLAGTAVYVYLSANNNTENSPAESAGTDESSNATAPEQDLTPATVEDIDQTASEVDQAVNALDEASDFAEDDLSDETLGL